MGFVLWQNRRSFLIPGRSQTMKSKHLIQEDGKAHAVDLMAYQDGSPCWEIQVYDEIADAMKEAKLSEQV